MDLVEIAEYVKEKNVKFDDRLSFGETVAAYVNWGAVTLLGLVCQYKYDKEWDKALNGLLDKYEGDVRHASHCLITLGAVDVWIENRWYASGHIWPGHGVVKKFRPSVKTLGRLHKRADVLLAELREKEQAELQKRYKEMLEGV